MTKSDVDILERKMREEREQYYEDHARCPKCKSDKGISQTCVGHIHLRLGEYKDNNRANCSTCKWVGKVVDLLPRVTPPSRLSVILDVGDCARCKEDHTNVEFVPFRRHVEDTSFTHWAMCPVTGEPILMGYTK